MNKIKTQNERKTQTRTCCIDSSIKVIEKSVPVYTETTSKDEKYIQEENDEKKENKIKRSEDGKNGNSSKSLNKTTGKY